jgi:response regulator RpfG family c-di-GMP phosphodiesterase
VDDEELIAVALGEILRQAKYEVVTFSQPLLALEELKRRDFSIVISDQRMPGLSGLELLSEAKKLRPNATRILITGVLDLNTVIEAINKGEIFRFIVKPWLREEFLATISNAQHRYELLCQNDLLQASVKDLIKQLTLANTSLEEKLEAAAGQQKQLSELKAKLEKTIVTSREFWLHVLEEFSPALGAQTRCAFQVCQSLAEMLKLSTDDVSVFTSAACLYDIGLLSLPRSMLQRWQEKPEELQEAEWELISQHPVFSQQLGVSASGSVQVAEIVRSHHENFDGGGYPDGLSGEGIPWLARLLAPVVSYASSREPVAQRIVELKAGAGSVFDPKAVQVLLRALPMAGLPSQERAVSLKDLAPGMIVARGVYSQTGVLLASEGQRLSEAYIQKLRIHAGTHPLTQSFVVYC